MPNKRPESSSSTRGQASPFRVLSGVRRKSDEHPIVMLALVAGIAAVGTMVLTPPGASAFRGPVSPYAERAPADLSPFEIEAQDSSIDWIGTCRGQFWGEEQADCLAAIARSAGRPDRLIRMVVAAEPMSPQGPNIF